MANNIIVGQSGGPTSVINSSLGGVFSAAKALNAGKVYGMLNGIKGLLSRRYTDLSTQITSGLDLELLKRTPSSFLGSCRFKLPSMEQDSEVYKEIFGILKELEIKHFFYIGGNDSMDTIHKLWQYAHKNKIDINFMGVPKTIDNDLAVTDHSPGFGSAAKYVATITKEIVRDSLVYNSDQVTVIEVMGRNAGWLTAAAALARDEDCEGPDMVLLPEVVFNKELVFNKIEKLRKHKKSIVLAVSEGIRDEKGVYVCQSANIAKSNDAFGHLSLGGTAYVLSNMVAEKFGCKIRPIELSTLQRSAAHISSLTDVNEAFEAGARAVKAAFEGQSGKVVIFKRIFDNPYAMETEVVDVAKVANLEKKIPLDWIVEEGTNISDKIAQYARPLIAGELTPIMVNGLPRHLILK